MDQNLLLEKFYPHSPEQVWQALTDRRILSAWMMDNNFEACLGHQFQFQSHSCLGQKLTIYCKVLEIEAPKRLAYSWQERLTSQPSRVSCHCFRRRICKLAWMLWLCRECSSIDRSGSNRSTCHKSRL